MNRGQVDVTWFQPFHLSFSLCVSNFWQKTVQYAKKSCLMKTCVTSLLWNSFTLSGIHSVIVFFSPVAQLNDLRSHLLCWLITCVTDTILGKNDCGFWKQMTKATGVSLSWLFHGYLTLGKSEVMFWGHDNASVVRTWGFPPGRNWGVWGQWAWEGEIMEANHAGTAKPLVTAAGPGWHFEWHPRTEYEPEPFSQVTPESLAHGNCEIITVVFSSQFLK